MKSIIAKIIITICLTGLVSCTILYFVYKKAIKDNEQIYLAKNSEFININVLKDTSDYTTSVIESNNVEMPNLLLVNFKLEIMNVANLDVSKIPIIINNFEIIENPYENGAPYSYGKFPNNQNGLFVSDTIKIKFPVKLIPYQPLYCIIKHGQTIDSETLEFIKTHFKDIKKLKAKEVFKALLDNGLNLCNDSTTEQIFQLQLFSTRYNTFTRDFVFPYTNYCK